MEATKLRCIGFDEESSLLIFETPGGEKIYAYNMDHTFEESAPEKGGFIERKLVKSEVTFEIDRTKQ